MRRRLQLAQHRQADARRALAQHGHRRGHRPAAGLLRGQGDPRQSLGRLGHPVRQADLRLQALGRSGGARSGSRSRSWSGSTSWATPRRRTDSPELEEARQELVKLQKGDPGNVALWQKFTEISWRAFQEIYDQLGIRFDHHLGESFYNDKVAAVCRELAAGRDRRRERGRPRRVPPGASPLQDAAVHHPQVRRRRQLRDDRPRDDALPRRALARDGDPLRRRQAPGRPLRAAVPDGEEVVRAHGPAPAGARARRLRHGPRRGRQAPEDPQRREHQAEGPAGRGRRARLRAGQREEPGVPRGGAPRDRGGRGHRLGAVRRPRAEPLERLRVLVGQDDLPGGQHRRLPPVRGRPDPLDLPPGRARPRRRRRPRPGRGPARRRRRRSRSPASSCSSPTPSAWPPRPSGRTSSACTSTSWPANSARSTPPTRSSWTSRPSGPAGSPCAPAPS